MQLVQKVSEVIPILSCNDQKICCHPTVANGRRTTNDVTSRSDSSQYLSFSISHQRLLPLAGWDAPDPHDFENLSSHVAAVPRQVLPLFHYCQYCQYCWFCQYCQYLDRYCNYFINLSKYWNKLAKLFDAEAAILLRFSYSSKTTLPFPPFSFKWFALQRRCRRSWWCCGVYQVPCSSPFKY